MDFLRRKLRKRSVSTPSQDDKQKTAECRNCDVVVIGSGLSGLTTAYRLAKLDVSVIVVEEGRDRLNLRREMLYRWEGPGVCLTMRTF